MNTLVLWHPYNAKGEFPYSYDDTYKQQMASFIRDYEPVLREAGMWEKSMVLGFDDITHREAEYRERAEDGARDIAEFIKRDFPDLRLAAIGGPPLPRGMDDLMNVWIPQTSIIDRMRRGEYLDLLKQDHNELFFYWVYGDPGFMVDQPGMAPRLLSWIAFKHGATGISYYSLIRTPDFANAPTGVDWPHSRYNIQTFKNRTGRNGDGSLVYPAPDGMILSSIRLQNIRDGIEDFEYLAILRELLKDRPGSEYHRLLELPDELVAHRNYPENPSELDAWRGQIAEAIAALKSR